MMRRHLGYEFAVLAIVGTLAIFFFPAVTGPYPIVHGPATALRAMRAWLLLMLALTLSFAIFLKLLMSRLAMLAISRPTLNQLDLLQQSSILRC
jgi:hypothetical protein